MYGERKNDNVHARTLLTRVDSGARCADEGKEKEQVAKREATEDGRLSWTRQAPGDGGIWRCLRLWRCGLSTRSPSARARPAQESVRVRRQTAASWPSPTAITALRTLQHMSIFFPKRMQHTRCVLCIFHFFAYRRRSGTSPPPPTLPSENLPASWTSTG